MKQSFDIQPPPELQGSADSAGNFQAAMSEGVRPSIEAVISEAQSGTKYAFLASEYSIEEERTGDGVTWSVRNAHPLFRILEGGTRPHIIRAVNGPYLIFPFMGHFIKVASVNHPGTQGEHVLRDAWGRGLENARAAGGRALHAWTLSYGSSAGTGGGA